MWVMISISLMVNWVVWAPGALDCERESPYERDCYLVGAGFESQTTGPQTTNLPLVECNEMSCFISVSS